LTQKNKKLREQVSGGDDGHGVVEVEIPVNARAFLADIDLVSRSFFSPLQQGNSELELVRAILARDVCTSARWNVTQISLEASAACFGASTFQFLWRAVGMEWVRTRWLFTAEGEPAELRTTPDENHEKFA